VSCRILGGLGSKRTQLAIVNAKDEPVMSQINRLRDHCSGTRAAPVDSVVILINVGGGQKETCFTFLSTAWSVASGPLGSSGSELELTSIVDFRDEGHSLVGGLRRMAPLKYGSQKAFAGHMV
jgi:hypothetical protein